MNSVQCTMHLPFYLRLWGSPGTAEYPVVPSAILEAREKGINRTSAAGLFMEELPEFTHHPLLQSTMQQESLRRYRPPCWVRGYCLDKVSPGQASTEAANHSLLHGMLVKEIRSQISSNLPGSMGKEFLASGDAAIAVRFGKESVAKNETTAKADNDSVECKIFLIANMSLRPINAVLASMDLKQEVEGGPRSRSASLSTDANGRFVFQTSMELVSSLLADQKDMPSLIYVNVLEHKPVCLNSTRLD